MSSRPEPRPAAVRRLLTRLLRDPGCAVTLSAGDLDLALRVTRRARLLGRLAARLERARLLERLPPQAADQLASATLAAAAQQRVARWELNRIAWALRGRREIRVVALKGCAYQLADLPNAAGRTFADVDLLVAEPELDRVERILNEHGWRGRELSPYDDHYYRAWTHEVPPIVHEEREIEIDLHHNILPRTSRLKPPAARLLEAARPIPGERFERLADVDLVLHAMTHLMFDSEMADSLRDLVDVAELVEHFSAIDRSFFDRLLPRAAELDLERPAFYALRYADRLLATPIPDAVLRRSRDGAPVVAIVWFMDRLVPRALFPLHPDAPDPVAKLARLLLYVRSLWIRMPPLLLFRHLAYKFYVRRFGSAFRARFALRRKPQR